MARKILDDDLRSWEAFANTGPYGFADRAAVVFHCTTDPTERPRSCPVPGDKSDAELLLARASRAELVGLFGQALPLR